jgi:hypothetical protein
MNMKKDLIPQDPSDTKLHVPSIDARCATRARIGREDLIFPSGFSRRLTITKSTLTIPPGWVRGSPHLHGPKTTGAGAHTDDVIDDGLEPQMGFKRSSLSLGSRTYQFVEFNVCVYLSYIWAIKQQSLSEGQPTRIQTPDLNTLVSH